MYRSLFIGILIFIFHSNNYAQYGCTDPQAINYNATATINNGSCTYANTYYTLNNIDTLPTIVDEISGMVYYNGKLYVHNDSGSPAILYEIDTNSLQITKEIFLQGITNVDWEDITQDDTHFYIGDIGNNAGNRTNLRIYKFPKSAIGNNYYDTIENFQIEVIQYQYPDQIDFTPNNNNTAFDCEAIAYNNNKLHLFTKNWIQGISVHYTLPIQAGNYTATKIDSLFTQDYRITGADFATNKQLMLIAYQTTGLADVALWYIYDYNNADSVFATGNKRLIQCGNAIQYGQTEGICFKDTANGWVSNEKFNPIAQVFVPQSMYVFDTKNWYPYQYNTWIYHTNKDTQKNLQVNSTNGNITLKYETAFDENIILILYSHKGKKWKEKTCHFSPSIQQITITDLHIPDGIYIIMAINEKGEKRTGKFIFKNR